MLESLQWSRSAPSWIYLREGKEGMAKEGYGREGMKQGEAKVMEGVVLHHFLLVRTVTIFVTLTSEF